MVNGGNSSNPPKVFPKLGNLTPGGGFLKSPPFPFLGARLGGELLFLLSFFLGKKKQPNFFFSPHWVLGGETGGAVLCFKRKPRGKPGLFFFHPPRGGDPLGGPFENFPGADNYGGDFSWGNLFFNCARGEVFGRALQFPELTPEFQVFCEKLAPPPPPGFFFWVFSPLVYPGNHCFIFFDGLFGKKPFNPPFKGGPWRGKL